MVTKDYTEKREKENIVGVRVLHVELNKRDAFILPKRCIMYTIMHDKIWTKDQEYSWQFWHSLTSHNFCSILANRSRNYSFKGKKHLVLQCVFNFSSYLACSSFVFYCYLKLSCLSKLLDQLSTSVLHISKLF